MNKLPKYHIIFAYLPVKCQGKSCQVMELLIAPESKMAAVIGSYSTYRQHCSDCYRRQSKYRENLFLKKNANLNTRQIYQLCSIPNSQLLFIRYICFQYSLMTALNVLVFDYDEQHSTFVM